MVQRKSLSGGLGRGIEMVLLTGNARDLFWTAIGFTALRSTGIKFGGKSRNGSQSKDLLGRECDAAKRSTRNDLKDMNGAGTEIKRAVTHAHTSKMRNLIAHAGGLWR